jgi:hypothetical protein
VTPLTPDIVRRLLDEIEASLQRDAWLAYPLDLSRVTLGPMATPTIPSSPASPGTMHEGKALSDAELRIARLEEDNAKTRALLADRIAQAAKEAEEQGLLGRSISKVFGKSWSTSFYGVLAAGAGVVAVLPDNGHPVVFGLTLHQLAGGASALAMGLLGFSSKSKNVTGTEKPH